MMTTSRFDRPDVRQARLIDVALLVQRTAGTRAAAALLVQRTAGTRAAAALLANAGVGFRLTVRVLSEPTQRRGCVRRTFALVAPRH